MKIQVKHPLKTDVGSAFKLCTEQKSQEAVYAKLPGSDVKIKRDGRAPNVKLRISRKMPANPPAASSGSCPRRTMSRTRRTGQRMATGSQPTLPSISRRAGQDRRNQDAAARERRQLGPMDVRHHQQHPAVGGSSLRLPVMTQEEPRGRVQGAEGVGLVRTREFAAAQLAISEMPPRAERATLAPWHGCPRWTARSSCSNRAAAMMSAC